MSSPSNAAALTLHRICNGRPWLKRRSKIAQSGIAEGNNMDRGDAEHVEHTVKQQVRHPIQALAETSVILAAVATIPIVILEENGSAASWLIFAEWLIWSLFVF